MSTLLKFKTVSESAMKAKLHKLDNNKYTDNEEIIYTDIPCKPMVSTTSVIDKQNFDKIRRNLILNLQSVEI